MNEREQPSGASPRPPAALVLAPEPMDRRRLRHRLEEAGFGAVYEAGELHEALRQLASVPVDMVFAQQVSSTSVVMEEIRAAEQGKSANPNVPVVILVEDGPNPEHVPSIKAGAAAVIPLNPEADVLRELRAAWISPNGGNTT